MPLCLGDLFRIGDALEYDVFVEIGQGRFGAEPARASRAPDQGGIIAVHSASGRNFTRQEIRRPVSSRSRGAAGMGSRPPVSRRSTAPTHRHRRLSGRRTTGPPIKGASVSYGSKGLGLRMRDVVVSRAQGEVASVPRDGADLPRSPWRSPPSARQR